MQETYSSGSGKVVVAAQASVIPRLPDGERGSRAVNQAKRYFKILLRTVMGILVPGFLSNLSRYPRGTYTGTLASKETNHILILMNQRVSGKRHP